MTYPESAATILARQKRETVEPNDAQTIDALVEMARQRFPYTCAAGLHGLKYRTQDCYACDRAEWLARYAKGGAR